MTANPNKDLHTACKNGDINAANIAIARGAVIWDWGLRGACEGGHIEIANMIIAHGATDWNSGLCGACEGGHVELANMMIKYGATYWDLGLLNACLGGQIELVKMMIEYGATDWDIAHHCSQNIQKYIKAQWKLHDAKSVPIIRMLRRHVKFLRSAKRIQRWWRCTFPLWRELAYAPNGIRYRQSLEHFTQNLKLLKKF